MMKRINVINVNLFDMIVDLRVEKLVYYFLILSIILKTWCVLYLYLKL
jgi:hypothetical protein